MKPKVNGYEDVNLLKMYNAGTKVPAALMKIMSIIQMLLSAIGLFSLGALLFVREKVIDKVSSESLKLDEKMIEEAKNLAPLNIITSMIFLALGLVLAVIIFKNSIRFNRGEKVSFAPFIYLILVQISGVSIDILRGKEDPVGFSIIGSILLVSCICIYCIIRRDIKETIK
ncbi:hypothetical protein RAH41_06830 [Gottfriedia acidiceleris]|uniref:hypothetical protein n=1 Tax=Gottfriedia acidiceleris TaxID=371036 RepID=UPI002F25F089